jgi:hypothetical protein
VFTRLQRPFASGGTLRYRNLLVRQMAQMKIKISALSALANVRTAFCIKRYRLLRSNT